MQFRQKSWPRQREHRPRRRCRYLGRELSEQSAVPRGETAELPLPVLKEHVGNRCLFGIRCTQGTLKQAAFFSMLEDWHLEDDAGNTKLTSLRPEQYLDALVRFMLVSSRRDEMPDLLTKRDYQKLLTDVRRIIQEGKEEAARAAAQMLIESYWSIGKRIAKEKLNSRAGYHNAILADLSGDLSIGVRTLQRTVTFYQTYKRPPRLEGLSWAHYRILMQLQDPAERGFYEQLALTDGLSAERLTTAIQGARYESAQHHKSGQPLKLPRPSDPSYLYKAEVRDVIDADTLLLDIDLGFEVIRRQSIRLARIDAPPRDTPEGAAGRRYVRKQLAVARTVIVNTRKYDIHRRYVGHIFYAFNNRGIEHTFVKGRYLNQELLDKGFAKVV